MDAVSVSKMGRYGKPYAGSCHSTSLEGVFYRTGALGSSISTACEAVNNFYSQCAVSMSCEY